MSGMDPSQSTRLCHHCDLLLEVPKTGNNGKAYCPRCGTLLESGNPFPATTSLPLLLTALLLLTYALFLPFMGFEASGRENTITLAEGIANVFEYDEPVFALLAFVMVVIYPAVMIAILLILVSGFRTRIARHRLFRKLLRWAKAGTDWTMVEVFIIGIMVSLVKISSMADVQLGEGFFLYCAFAVVFTITIRKIDVEELWNRKQVIDERIQ